MAKGKTAAPANNKDAAQNARHARTEARKEANRQKNEARHQANLKYMQEHGLTRDPYEKQITVTRKRGKKIEVITYDVTKLRSPSTLRLRHEKLMRGDIPQPQQKTTKSRRVVREKPEITAEIA